MKDVRIGKKEDLKLLPVMEDMNVYMKIQKQKQTIQRKSIGIDKFGKLTEYKVNIQILALFPHTSYKQLDNLIYVISKIAQISSS